MDKDQPVSVFWFRRDLRLDDNAGLYHALKGEHPVLPVFIFDKEILNKLEDRNDARVTFIYQTIEALSEQLRQHSSSLLVLYDKAENAWHKLVKDYNVAAVYTNQDYEPYAKKRDGEVGELLKKNNIPFHTYKDQVVFDKGEVLKDDGKPYTVFTPYSRKWHQKLKPFFLKSYPNKKYFKNFARTGPLQAPALQEMGFVKSDQKFPSIRYQDLIADYAKTRDFPGIDGTTHIGLHLRFGSVSIRQLASEANEHHDKTWLNELIWREFFMMALDNFPQTADHSFKPEYDRIKWVNDERQFEAWCEGKTGYPLVDAGMRELNATGFMHNRVRMVVASFLTKDLLIDWRWGERYFARKLLDYEMASNVGNWQWCAGCGTDAAPYFRIFNPDAQLKRFDPNLSYVKKWVPEYADFTKYPRPIIDHDFARTRCLKVFKEALK